MPPILWYDVLIRTRGQLPQILEKGLGCFESFLITFGLIPLMLIDKFRYDTGGKRRHKTLTYSNGCNTSVFFFARITIDTMWHSHDCFALCIKSLLYPLHQMSNCSEEKLPALIASMNSLMSTAVVF